MAGALENFLTRRGLACACVLAPLVLGIFGNWALSGWMYRGSEVCAISRMLAFRLLDETTATPLKLTADEQKECDARAARHAAEAAPIAPAAAPPVADGKPDKNEDKVATRLSLVANHIAGRLNVVYAYSFLLLVSVLAFAFGSFVVVKTWGWKAWAGITAVFLALTAVIAWLDVQGGGVRFVVADNVLKRADAHVLLQFLPVGDHLRILIAVGLCVGYLSVGLILAALFLASLRTGDETTRADLEMRLFVIRAGLILGSAILVIVVLSSRAVLDWPLSLLMDGDKKALAPAADALVRKWGAIGSIALIGAFLPAVAAWYLDRDRYRTLLAKSPETLRKDAEGELLEIAPMSTVTSIVALLAPILASPLFDTVKSLVAVISKP